MYLHAHIVCMSICLYNVRYFYTNLWRESLQGWVVISHLPVSVNDSSSKEGLLGRQAFKTPNRRLESSFRWKIARRRWNCVLATELLRVSESWYDSLITCTRTRHQASRGDSQVSQRRARSGQWRDRKPDNRPDKLWPSPRTPGRGSPTPCSMKGDCVLHNYRFLGSDGTPCVVLWRPEALDYCRVLTGTSMFTANLRTGILGFRGSDLGRILILRCCILMSIGNFPESLSQTILIRKLVVGRLGVSCASELATKFAPRKPNLFCHRAGFEVRRRPDGVKTNPEGVEFSRPWYDPLRFILSCSTLFTPTSQQNFDTWHHLGSSI